MGDTKITGRVENDTYVFNAYVYSCGKSFNNVAWFTDIYNDNPLFSMSAPLGFYTVKEMIKQFDEWKNRN